MMRRPYTESEFEIIAAGWAAGDRIVDIAPRIGRTTTSVAAYASKHGLISPLSLGEAAIERIVERAEEGWATTRLARQYGVHPAVISRTLVRQERIGTKVGPKTTRTRLNEEEIAEIVRRARDGQIVSHIAAATGRSANAVKENLIRLGVPRRRHREAEDVRPIVVDVLVDNGGEWITSKHIAGILQDRGLHRPSKDAMSNVINRIRDSGEGLVPAGHVIESKRKLGYRLRRAA